MNTRLCAAWLVVLSVGPVSAGTLPEARQRWLHGNYEEARSLYETLARDGKQQISATLGLSRTWESQGEYDKALQVIEAALADNAKNADLHARRAELLYLRGRWTDAEQAADKALALQPANFLAHWIRGQVARDRADTKKADTEFRWIVRTYTERENQDKPIKDPDELLVIGQAASENARWHNLLDQFSVILNDVYFYAGEKLDPNFWPAEYQAGMLLLEKYNYGEALPAFDAVLKVNPSAAPALVGKGIAALQHYEIKDAELFAERALKINPNLPDALRLRADIHLAAGDTAAANQVLEHARKVNPRDEGTLGRVAACLLLRHDQHAFDALVQEVTQHDPKPGLFYQELAERLEARRRYEAAEKYYQKAIELRPMVPWALDSLGLLYMRMGREKEALDILTRAFKADGHNVRVSNSLKVLRHLERYETLKTDHFVLRFDPKSDGPLARYMVEYLEAIYADLDGKFKYHPPAPILVEVFNNHDMFSGRVVALPDLHTIGASTGRIVAIDSPQDKRVGKPFNWARVLRHELVHVFNLEQTDFQVPHWFTEGLAVINEGYPRPQPWNMLLRERVPAGRLMSLDDIDLGFIRPRSPEEWHMAYCQSQLYVEYLKSQYGPRAISEMLSAYREGLDSGAAIAMVCHVDKAAFEKGYRAHLEEVVKTIQGRPIEKKLTFNQLKKAHEAEPDNEDVAARLSEQYLIRRDKKQARSLAEEVLKKKPAHPLAAYVKARLVLDSGDEDTARKLLEAVVDRKDPELKVLQALGKLYFDAREYDKAADLYELGHKVEPYESKWLVELARVHTQTGADSRLIDVLKELVPTDADDLDNRRRLAELLLKNGRAAEAEHYAREALEIDLYDPDSQTLLQDALLRQDKGTEAARLHKLLEK
jgi:tetratricopeptide (TPR) repeat protein